MDVVLMVEKKVEVKEEDALACLKDHWKRCVTRFVDEAEQFRLHIYRVKKKRKKG